jgi:hypothetical protein
MLRFLLFSICSIPLFAQPVPAKPAGEAVAVAPVAKTPDQERKETLKKLIDAAVLMLEAKAHRQFIQAFVEDEDRRRFEQAYTRNGAVNYDEWGKEKGVQMLKVLRQIAAMDPTMTEMRACFAVPDIPRGRFSFVFLKGAWFIENKSVCPAEILKKSETPAPK